MCVGSRRMLLMNLFSEQQWRNRHREQTYGQGGGEEGEGEMNGERSSPIFSPEESHGQRNLVGYNPWGCKESDTTEQLSACLPCAIQ